MSQEQKEQRLVETDTINTVLKYLSGRPYVEVMNVIPLLVNLPIVPASTITPAALTETEQA